MSPSLAGGGPTLISLIHRFSARLEGDSKWIKHNRQRKIIVCFAPQQAGLHEAILELTLCDQSCGVDFVVKRSLVGRAAQRTSGQGDKRTVSTHKTDSQPINDDYTRVPAYEEVGLLDSDGTGISVSHAHGLDFGIVERKRPNGPFATPSSVLTIKHSDGFPAVTFAKEHTRTLDGSDPECVISLSQCCLYSLLH